MARNVTRWRVWSSTKSCDVTMSAFRYVMQELIDTERDYVRDLGLIVEVSFSLVSCEMCVTNMHVLIMLEKFTLLLYPTFVVHFKSAEDFNTHKTN